MTLVTSTGHRCIMLSWRPLDHVDMQENISYQQARMIEKRLKRVLRSWQGTPYREGSCRKGAGVDCVRFMCAVADELYGYSRELPSRLPADRALHDPEGARAAMRALLRLYSPLKVVSDNVVEPGDAVVVGPRGGGPGHVLLAGFDSLHPLWHVERTGVVYTGPGISHYDLFGIFRPLDKHLWFREAD